MGGPHVVRDLVPRLVPRADPLLLADLGAGVLVGRVPPEDDAAWSYRTASFNTSLFPPSPDGSGLVAESQVFGLSKTGAARAQKDVVTIGRSTNNDVVLAHGRVSKLHARVRLGTPLTLEDAGSSNGTQVDSKKLPPDRPVPLVDGAVVTFGTVVLTFFTRDTFLSHVRSRAAQLR